MAKPETTKQRVSCNVCRFEQSAKTHDAAKAIAADHAFRVHHDTDQEHMLDRHVSITDAAEQEAE